VPRKLQIKKVRKKHDSTKAARRMTSKLNTWTWQSLAAIGPGPATSAEMKMGGSWLPVTQKMQSVFYREPMDWIIAMRALCEAPDGEVYIESVSFTLRNMALQALSQDEAFDTELRRFLMEDVKMSQCVDVGWIAHTFMGPSWEPDSDKVGAWVSKGLGWLSIGSPWRKRQWHDIDHDTKQSQLEGKKNHEHEPHDVPSTAEHPAGGVCR